MAPDPTIILYAARMILLALVVLGALLVAEYASRPRVRRPKK